MKRIEYLKQGLGRLVDSIAEKLDLENDPNGLETSTELLKLSIRSGRSVESKDLEYLINFKTTNLTELRFFNVFFESDILEKFEMQAKFIRRRFSGGYVFAQDNNNSQPKTNNVGSTNPKVEYQDWTIIIREVVPMFRIISFEFFLVYSYIFLWKSLLCVYTC